MATTPDHDTRLEAPTASIAITEAQKQALIDNLQLEVTERARKLRAQYALQAQGLRTRLEMRVNRIPQALRRTNMQELVDKYAQPTKPAPKTVPVQKPSEKQMSSSPVMTRGIKRSSDVFRSSDKENENPGGAIENPKKRTKTTAPGPAHAAPTAAKGARNAVVARKPVPGQVLSPKSQNSRTFPQSPLKPAVPPKTFVPRPASPAKPVVTAPPKQTRPVSRQTKRPAAAASTAPQAATEPAPGADRGRSASDASTNTTVVKKQPASTAATRKVTAPAAPAPPPATTTAAKTKKTGTIRSAIQSLTGSKRGKAAMAAKAEAAAAAAVIAAEPAKTTTVGGRTLRKRG